MRKTAALICALLAVIGLAVALLGNYLNNSYIKFRRDLNAGLKSEVAPLLSPKEKEFLGNFILVKNAEETENVFYSALPSRRLMEPFGKTADYRTLRSNVREKRLKISGASWRASALRGQLAVRDLILGILGKAEEQELKQIWQQAMEAYKESRLVCDSLRDIEEYRLCVDTTTKSYEFLIKPSGKGGLGNLASSGGEGKEKQLDIPLIRGSGAGAGAGVFGQR